MVDAYTEDLSKFGRREREMLEALLGAWNRSGLPDDFNDEGVKPAMNTSSGFVFLVNEDFQVAMMNGDKLESFYTTPYEGREGFWEDLVDEYDTMHRDDRRYMRQIKGDRALPEDNDDGEEE